MTVRFVYRRVDSIPPMAWCARLRSGSVDVSVTHGRWVEANDRFFFEGAWNGDFDDGALFVTPTHMLERIQCVRVGDELFVSNSLPFLITATQDWMHSRYKFYHF